MMFLLQLAFIYQVFSGFEAVSVSPVGDKTQSAVVRRSQRKKEMDASTREQQQPSFVHSWTKGGAGNGSHVPKRFKRLAGAKKIRNHAIPHVLIFSHWKNILTEDIKGTEALKKNILAMIAMHPGSNVSFVDDDECRSALARSPSPELAYWFDEEKQGCYKSDMCRLAVLYDTGGYYFDNDFDPVKDVRTLVPPGASISTVMAMTDQATPSIGLDGRLDVFQAFLAAAPKHPVIKRAMEFTLKWYQTGYAFAIHNGERLMWWNHPRRDGPCETIDPERCHQTLAGPVFVGKALREWMNVDYLHLGRMDGGRGCHWEGDATKNKCAYLFTETADTKKYGLAPRNKETGWSRCAKEPFHGWCNMVVADETHHFGWSRSPDAAEFEGYDGAS
jgi:hypothetical protein